MNIALAIQALYRGSQLAKVETWKKAGVAATVMTGFLSALVGLAVSFGWLDQVDPQTIMEISSALVTLVSVVLGYLQVATTEKIGLGGGPAQSERVQSVPDQAEPKSAARSDVDAALRQWSGMD
jgi:hypothetical protein